MENYFDHMGYVANHHPYEFFLWVGLKEFLADVILQRGYVIIASNAEKVDSTRK